MNFHSFVRVQHNSFWDVSLLLWGVNLLLRVKLCPFWTDLRIQGRTCFISRSWKLQTSQNHVVYIQKPFLRPCRSNAQANALQAGYAMALSKACVAKAKTETKDWETHAAKQTPSRICPDDAVESMPHLASEETHRVLECMRPSISISLVRWYIATMSCEVWIALQIDRVALHWLHLSFIEQTSYKSGKRSRTKASQEIEEETQHQTNFLQGQQLSTEAS